MKKIELKKGIYWVGGIDWNLRNFHGYLTQRGSTYNAYLIVDDKITLIDTVKHYLFDEMLQRISEIIDPTSIDYIISNHVEMDHSGAISKMLEISTNATVVTCPNGEKGLSQHFDTKNWKIQVVKNGDTLNLGERSLQFLLTPMVHWPDNMVEYMPSEKILFSNDSFGQHFASSNRFDDQCPSDIIIEEAKKYYANIVMPYSAQVLKELEAAKDLDIRMIAPSHGIIWREFVGKIVSEYSRWASNKPKHNAVIIYDTMWGSTEKMARIIQEAFDETGYNTSLRSLKSNHISDIITDVLDSEYICVGSPTLNNNLLPSNAAFLTYLKGLSPKNRKALAFGSYGWGGQSIGQVEDYLKDCGFEVKYSTKERYIPNNEKLAAIKKGILEILKD